MFLHTQSVSADSPQNIRAFFHVPRNWLSHQVAPLQLKRVFLLETNLDKPTAVGLPIALARSTVFVVDLLKPKKYLLIFISTMVTR